MPTFRLSMSVAQVKFFSTLTAKTSIALKSVAFSKGISVILAVLLPSEIVALHTFYQSQPQ